MDVKVFFSKKEGFWSHDDGWSPTPFHVDAHADTDNAIVKFKNQKDVGTLPLSACQWMNWISLDRFLSSEFPKARDAFSLWLNDASAREGLNSRLEEHDLHIHYVDSHAGVFLIDMRKFTLCAKAPYIPFTMDPSRNPNFKKRRIPNKHGSKR
ncbi:MAG: hypothetical protein GY774_12120 [Planctomycetes bacterium]|nr:hypothetical protein [Planctomycetota bacterium]